MLVSDGSERIWGNSDTPSTRLVNLNKRYKQDYGIPKDFGPFPLQLRELYPPYKPDRELTLEIARLKLQGKAVYGTYSLNEVPMPSKEDFLLDFKHFEEWWDAEFSRHYPIKQLTLRACVNTVLLHLNRFLIMRTDVIEFDKRRIIPSCVSYDAPFLDQTVISIVDRHLKSENVTEEEINSIRRYVSYLRHNMNAFLGISSE